MTIKEFYEVIGGDYNDAINRFGSDDLIKIFLKKFTNDDSFTKLIKASKDNNVKDAFSAVHALKGVAGNMSFSSLYETSSILTEQLRALNNPIDLRLINEIENKYIIIIQAINTL